MPEPRRPRTAALLASLAITATLLGPWISRPTETLALSPSSGFFVDDVGGNRIGGRAITVHAPDPGLVQGAAGIDNAAPGDRLTFRVDPVIPAGPGQPWFLRFHAPEGQVLHPGSYTAAPIYDDPDGLAFFDITGGDATSCTTTEAFFTIYEIAVDPVTSAPTTFAASFEDRCGDDSLFGEIRMNSTVPMVSRDVSPLTVALPLVHVGSTGSPSPIVVTNTGSGALHPATATVEGPFSILSDGCAGRTLSGSATCEIQVASTPVAARTFGGWLTIHDDSVGSGHRIRLQGEGRDATTTTITSSSPTSIYPSNPTTLTIRVTPAPETRGFVQLCVVGGGCTDNLALGSGGTHTLNGNPSEDTVWYAKFLGTTYYDPSESAPISQTVRYRPTLRISASQTAIPPGHPVWIDSGYSGGQAPGGSLTLYDDLTGAIVGREHAQPGGLTDCFRPTEPGLHTYRIQYSGYGEDWLPTSKTVDVLVAAGSEILPAGVYAGSFPPLVQCQTLLGAPTGLTDGQMTFTPYGTTKVQLTDVRVSNSPTLDANFILADGATFPYGQPIDWSLTDTAHGYDPSQQAYVYFQFRGDNGLWSTVASQWFNLQTGSDPDPDPLPDLTAPSTSIPTSAFASGPGIVPVHLSWSGSDSGGSGIDRYELERSTDGKPYTPVSTALINPTLSVPLASGHSYRFRLRAVDGAGNIGAWAYGTTLRLTSIADSASLVRYGSGWHKTTGTGYWGGADQWSTKSSATASLTFTGRSIAWVARTGPSSGIARVYVNGVLAATVNLQNSTAELRRTMFARTWSSSARRTITIKVAGTAGHARVDVDGFVVGS